MNQTKQRIQNILAKAESYIQLKSKVKNTYHFVKKQRSYNHLKGEVKQVTAIPLSHTLNNLIIDQKIGRAL